jgi:hypothetical protein
MLNISKSQSIDNHNEDGNLVMSFATSPILTSSKSERSVLYSSRQQAKKNQNTDDVIHFKSTGTTSHSSSSISEKTTSHNDRINREIKQLVKDIKRIEPIGEQYCTFGLLFDDPQVEQYYEALVGTLKAARRQGVIMFKGQMLLKGMHDDVQITIVD